jgi:hypothetical protein
VRIVLAGLAFEVGPEAELQRADRAWLPELAREAAGADERAPFRVELQPQPPWADDPARYPDRAPARVRVHEGCLRVTHRRFLAEVDLLRGVARLFRVEADSAGLPITLRVALSAWLPRMGGLPLHAAGVDAGGRGLAFFGPSGSGKTTLAATSPHPVLSDELVALVGRPWHVVASGFWGALGDGPARTRAPLAGLFELDKGPFRLARLPPELALRRLLDSLLVPPEPGLWRDALQVAGQLVRDVPVYRLAWDPTEPPWECLATSLAGGAERLNSSSSRG